MRTYWTPIKVSQETVNYKNKSDLSQHASGLWKAARRFGLMEHIYFEKDFANTAKRDEFSSLLRDIETQMLTSPVRFDAFDFHSSSTARDIFESHCPASIHAFEQGLGGLLIAGENGFELSNTSTLAFDDFVQRLRSYTSINVLHQDKAQLYGNSKQLDFTAFFVYRYYKIDGMDGLYEEVLKELKQRGLDCLNRSQQHSSRRYWTATRIADEAKKYTTRYAFRMGAGGAYQAALDLGILDEVCAHMPKNDKVKWTKQSLLSAASRYTCLEHFKIAQRPAWRRSIELGLDVDIKDYYEHGL